MRSCLAGQLHFNRGILSKCLERFCLSISKWVKLWKQLCKMSQSWTCHLLHVQTTAADSTLSISVHKVYCIATGYPKTFIAHKQGHRQGRISGAMATPSRFWLVCIFISSGHLELIELLKHKNKPCLGFSGRQFGVKKIQICYLFKTIKKIVYLLSIRTTSLKPVLPKLRSRVSKGPMHFF